MTVNDVPAMPARLQQTITSSSAMWGSAPALLKVLIGLVLIVLTFVLSQRRKGALPSFRNDSGDRIKLINEDTRIARFTKGSELSKAGEALAGSEPYLVRNTSHVDLVLVTPEQLRQFIANDYKDHTKPRGGGLGDYAWRMLGSCVGQQSGQKWSVMRSHFDPEFSNHAARRAEPVFQRCISEWLASLSPTRDSRFVIDGLSSCHVLAFRLLAIMSYGDVLDNEAFAKLSNLIKLHKQVMGTLLFNTRTISRLYNMIPTAPKRLLNEYNRLWTQFNLEAIQKAKDEGVNCPVERIYAGVEQGDMSLAEFLQSLDEMLYTNIDITGSVLACLLNNIAHHPDFQDRLRAEIMAEKKQQGYSVVAFAGKQDTLLHYLTLESVRLNGALHFSPAACTAEDKVIGGYHIPGGTPCIVDVLRLNTNKEAWGADAKTFRPERFAGLAPSAYRFSMIRWGVGASKCLGKNMADLLLKMMVVAVLERFELRLAKTEQNTGEKNYLFAGTSNKKEGIEFRPIL